MDDITGRCRSRLASHRRRQSQVRRLILQNLLNYDMSSAEFDQSDDTFFDNLREYSLLKILKDRLKHRSRRLYDEISLRNSLIM